MSFNKLLLVNGAKIALLIVLYFLFMKVIGLEHESKLRFLNFFFVLWGINTAIKSNLIASKGNVAFDNYVLGVATAVLAVTLLIFGLIIYSYVIDLAFIEEVKHTFLLSGKLSLPLVVLSVFIEGVTSALIGTLAIMQYYKFVAYRKKVLN